MSPATPATWTETAARLDAADPLARFRERFVIRDRALIYLDGNSLGRLPASTPDRVTAALGEEWGSRLIRGWNDGWIDLPRRIGAKVANLVGADPDEVVVADSTSVNLFKLALSACLAQKGRTRIITDDLNFPSDLYVLQGIERILPEVEIVVMPSPDGVNGPTEAIISGIDENTALVTLSHTAFKSGFVYDMTLVNATARAAGALTLWDLSHSAGSVPVALSDSSADLAVGCTYKYLNGGPGAPAFLFVRRGLHEQLMNPVSGWMGEARPFEFDLEYHPSSGVSRFLTGTPPVMALVAMEAGIDLVVEAGMPAIRKKSVTQTELLRELWVHELRDRGFSFKSPVEAARRGSHVSLGHAEGWRINQALIEDMSVIPDFRAPDNLRLGIAPLYTSCADVVEAVDRLKRVVDDRLFERYSADTTGVT